MITARTAMELTKACREIVKNASITFCDLIIEALIREMCKSCGVNITIDLAHVDGGCVAHLKGVGETPLGNTIYAPVKYQKLNLSVMSEYLASKGYKTFTLPHKFIGENDSMIWGLQLHISWEGADANEDA